MRGVPSAHGGSQSLAQVLKKQLVGNPFTNGTIQWGMVEVVHGATSSALYAAAALGATSIETQAPPLVNDMLVIGTAPGAIRASAVTGSAAPFVVTLAQPLSVAQASGAAVNALNTLDLYLDGSQLQPNPAPFLTVGVRHLKTYTPAANDVVCVLRGAGGLSTDRIVVGSLA